MGWDVGGEMEEGEGGRRGRKERGVDCECECGLYVYLGTRVYKYFSSHVYLGE